MDFIFQVPTEIIVGKGCIKKHADVFSKLGKKALVVRSGSTEKNGSLADILDAMKQQGIVAKTLPSVPPNPTPEDVQGLLGYAPEFDFVVAAGGGSALDAAKGVAILAVNDVPPAAMYEKTYQNKPLPIIAVPTTCGTGSEVTAVSVLTVGDSKKSFSSPDILPKTAFLDAEYLKTLPRRVMLDTALDALSHSAEAYLLAESWSNDMIAEQAFRNFARYKDALISGEVTDEQRELMLYTATLGGLAIYVGGTSAVHTMGYPITVLKGIPHGRACALTLGEYIEFVYDAKKEKIDTMCALLGVDGIGGFQKLLRELIGQTVTCTEEEIREFVDIAAGPAMKKRNAKPIAKEDVLKLYCRALCPQK